MRINITDEYVITLEMILIDISKGMSYQWKIFYLDAIINNCKDKYSKIAEESKGANGYIIDWSDLIFFSTCIDQLFFGIFIGSNSNDPIKLINPSKEMYEKYDYYIETIDGGMWEIFTKDELFYNRLISKYKISEFLETDFEQHIYDD